MRNLLLAAAVAIGLSAQPAKADVDWGGIIIDTFETLGSSIEDIPEKTEGYNPSSWYRWSAGDVAVAGAGACSIPVAGYVALPAEFAYFMREVHNSVLGLGHLMYGDINNDDFATIISLWADDFYITQSQMNNIYELAYDYAKDEAKDKAIEFSEHMIEHLAHHISENKKVVAGSMAIAPGSQIANKVPVKTAPKAASKITTKVVAKKAGVKAAGKISTKAATKAGTKIAGKYAAKTVTAWIPFVSAAVCSGVNVWLMTSIMNDAWDFYEMKAIARQSAIR